MSDDGAGSYTERRRAVMRLCAAATAGELAAALAGTGYDGGVTELRRPETGLVMARGRVGGDGARFNLGEVTVTRAAVRLETGTKGFSYQLGRDGARAHLAATLDALWQEPRWTSAVESGLAAAARRLDSAREKQARQTAATKVDFFTMVRGED